MLEDSTNNSITLTGSTGPPNESGQTLTFFLASLPTHGTLSETSGGGSAVISTLLTDAILFYTPTGNYCGADSFNFYVKDNGGTDNGGDDTSPNATVSITVTCVNDAPAGTDNTVTTLEDTDHTFAAVNFGFSDPNDTPANTLLAVKITTLPVAGTLAVTGGPALAPGDFVTVADINLGKLKFSPVANDNGTPYTSFTFQVQDNGGVLNGGVDLDPTPNTMTINVTPVNDAPTASLTTGPSTQSVQYSDPISSLSIQVTDIDSPASAINLEWTASQPAGLTITKSCTGSGTLADPTVCTFNISGNILAASGSYDVNATDGSVDTGKIATINVTKETITIQYTGMVFVTVPSGGNANVQLAALITEQDDGTLGDITKAKVKFTISGDSGCPGLTVGNVAVGSTPTPGTGGQRGRLAARVHLHGDAEH